MVQMTNAPEERLVYTDLRRGTVGLPLCARSSRAMRYKHTRQAYDLVTLKSCGYFIVYRLNISAKRVENIA